MGRGRTSGAAWVALLLLICGFLAVAVLAGAPRTPLVPPLPEGVLVPSWVRRMALWFGLDGQTRRHLVLLTLGVLVGLVGAFAALVREAWRGRAGTWPVLAASGVALAIATAGPVLLSRDVSSYASYGRMVALYDANPYVETPADFPADPFTPVVSDAWIRTVSRYGPAFTLASAGVAEAWEGSPGGTILGFKLLSATGAALALAFSVVAARLIRPGREAFAAALVGLNPVIVVHTVGGGHNDGLVGAGLAGGLVLAILATRRASNGERPGHRGGGLALGVTSTLVLAAAVKVVAAVAMVVWIWSLVRASPRRSRLRVVAVHGGVALALSAVLFGPFVDGWRTVAPLVSLAELQGWASGPALVARGGRAIGDALDASGLGSVLEAVATVMFLAGFAIVLWSILRRATPRGSADTWGGSLLAFTLAAPYLVPWYAAWFVPLLPLVGDRALIGVGLAVGGLLALTGVPAEPAGDPAVWEGMLLGVHYVAAPAMLLLFLLAVWRIMRPGLEAPEPDPGPIPLPTGLRP